MQLAYIRVSTVEQNEQRQLEAMEPFHIEKFFTEKISGKNMDRPKLRELLEYAREGDTIHIHDFSRLARNTKDLLDIVDTLTEKGVTLVSNKEGIDTSTPAGRLMLTMIGAIAEFERMNLLERQREGIAIAKRAGKYKGGKTKTIPDFAMYYERYRTRQTTKTSLAAELHISRPTLDRMIADYERELGQKGSKPYGDYKPQKVEQ